MKRWYISIPHEVDLCQESQWLPGQECQYFVFRNHYVVKERQVKEPAKAGEKIALFQSAATLGRIFSGSEEQEIEITDISESIKEYFISNEIKVGLSSELTASISALSVGKMSSALKSQLEAALRNSTTVTAKAHTALVPSGDTDS